MLEMGQEKLDKYLFRQIFIYENLLNTRYKFGITKCLGCKYLQLRTVWVFVHFPLFNKFSLGILY